MQKRKMKSFSNETLNFFRKFWVSYILDLAKTVRDLRILQQKSTSNFGIKEFWALENHVPYLWMCYFAPIISHRYIKYRLVHSWKRLAYLFHVVLLRHSFKAAIFSRFLKVAITTWLYIYMCVCVCVCIYT